LTNQTKSLLEHELLIVNEMQPPNEVGLADDMQSWREYRIEPVLSILNAKVVKKGAFSYY